MPRTLTAPEELIIDAAHRWHHTRLEIEDADGDFQDLTDFLDRDWVTSVSWGETIDEPISELRFDLIRESGSVSLSPFRGDSLANDGGSAIDAGRGIRLYTATTEHGVAPVSGDWKLVFEGVIDSFDAAKSFQGIARDLAGELVDRQIKERLQYGSEEGTPIETVMQDILDAWAPDFTLRTPIIPGFLITSYWQDKMSVWDAIRTLAGLIGWDVRMRWDEDTSSFRLTFFEPDRDATLPVWTIRPDRYFDVTRLGVDRTNVRNVVRISYTDSENDDERAFVEDDDAASIARYGERWMEIEEASDSPINTEAEALQLLAAALSDLSTPTVEQEIEMPYFWKVQLGDFGRFEANDVHYDDDQDLAVTSIRHELSPGRERTVLGVRGKPVGFYRDWIRRGLKRPRISIDIIPETDETKSHGLLRLRARTTAISLNELRIRYQYKGEWTEWENVATTLPTEWFSVKLGISKLSKIGYEADYIDEAGNQRTVASEATFGLLRAADVSLSKFGKRRQNVDTVTFGGIPGELVDLVFVFVQTFEIPKTLTEGTVPEIGPLDAPVAVLDPAEDLDDAGFLTYTVDRPDLEHERYIWFVPIDADGEEGRIEEARVDAKVGALPFFDRFKMTGTLVVDVYGRINDPEGFGGTLSFWGPGHDFEGEPDGEIDVDKDDMPFSFGPSTVFEGSIGGTLLDAIAAPPNDPKHIAFRFDTTDGRTTGLVVQTLKTSFDTLIDEYGAQRVESWQNALKLASGTEGVGVGEDLPPDGSVYTDWYVPSENTLYNWDGDSWEVVEGAGMFSFGTALGGFLIVGAVNAQAIATGALAAKIAEIKLALIDELEIGGLSVLGDNIGAIIHGVLHNEDNTAGLDLDATGTDPFLYHNSLQLLADGTASFAGALSAATGSFRGNVEILAALGNSISFIDDDDITRGGLTYWEFGDLKGVVLSAGGGVVTIAIDTVTSESYAEISATHVTVAGQSVTGLGTGAVDSGGAGRRMLTVPN